MQWKSRFFWVFLLCCGWAYTAPLAGQTLQTRTVIDNIGIPWEILWGPDNMIWMTERQGRVSRLNPETGEVFILANIAEVKQINEGGLMGMALHPDFPTIPQVFVAYTYDNSGPTGVRVARYTYDNNVLVNPVVLIENIQGASIHDGCRLLFAPDKTLLITTGDASDQSLPQNHSSLNGKILRINTDGTIPADNPWPGSMLYTTGHRNPQGICFSPDGKLYSSEHGPNNDDEVNLIVPGRNYGWPVVHGFCDLPNEQTFCADSNVVEPLAAWTPTLAVCGLDYYNNSAIPEWQNSLLLVTLKASKLLALQLSSDGSQIIGQKEYLEGAFGRLRDVCIAPDGRVFISTSNASNNKVIEITGEMPVSVELTPSADTLDFGSLLQSDIEAEQELTITNTGSTTAIVTALTITGSGAGSFTLGNIALPLMLQPDQSISLLVYFHPISAGQHNAVLTVSTDIGGTSATVYLTGRKTILEVETTSSVDFGTVPVGSVRDTILVDFIRNTGSQDIEFLSLGVEPPFSIVSPVIFPFTIPGNTNQSVTIRFAPEQEGTYVGILTAQFEQGIQRTPALIGTASLSTSVREETVQDGKLTITPNPMRENVLFSFRARTSANASIEITDIMGRKVFGEKMNVKEGIVSVQWNGRDGNGQVCSPGVYSVTITEGRYRITSTFALIR